MNQRRRYLPLPRLPRVLDRSDTEALGRILFYSALIVWVAFIAGLAVRVFIAASFGGG